jgi:purine nucleosidase
MSRSAEQKIMATKVIIDTDTGIDDAMGCVLALQSPELEILGFTSVFGNVSVDLTTANTAILLEQLGRCEIPLARGAACNLLGMPVSFNPEVHGADGVGNAGLGHPTRVFPSPESAAEFIIASARKQPGLITFIALGPLTNLALALALDPGLPSFLTKVVWMGGAIDKPGNVSPVAEADALHDPEAAQVVLQAPWAVRMVPLDVTDNTLFHRHHLERVQRAGTPAARYVARIMPFYMDFYSTLLGEYACASHSPLTVATVALPQIVTAGTRLPINVETRGEWTRGMTVADRRAGRTSGGRRQWMAASVIEVVTDVDRDLFRETFLARLERET